MYDSRHRYHRGVSSFEEVSRDYPEPKHGAWRRLEPPVQVRAYFGNQWHDAMAVNINDDTRELRIELPVVRDERGVPVITHKVLSAALYRAPAGAL